MASQFFIGKREDIERAGRSDPQQRRVESTFQDRKSGGHDIGKPASSTRVPSHSVRLKIIVVGGGIAGLGAAITLSRAGHNVTVLEKSKSKKEAGFMITFGCNAVRVLNSFDFDFKRARAVTMPKVSAINAHTLVEYRSLTVAKREIEEDLFPRTMFRPDLHNELKRIALLESKDFPTPIIRQGCEVVDIDIRNGVITLRDGSQITGDLIVAADGERSVIKAAFGDGQQLRQAPYRIYRALVPIEKLVDHKRDMELKEQAKDSFAMFFSSDKQVSWFEGRDGLLQDLEAGYIVSEGDDPKAETDPEKAYAKMMQRFADIHPDLLNVLAKAENVTDWEVNFSRPLPRLWKGKAVLIGDAAHSMYPTTGQGGSQSMEDVGCLGILLSDLRSQSELESRLNLYQKVRKPRASTVQALSGIVYGTEEEFRKSRPWHPINKTPIKTLNDHVDFLYHYDILEESRKALDESRQGRANL